MTNHTDLLRRALDVLSGVALEHANSYAKDSAVLFGVNSRVFKNAELDVDAIENIIADLRTAIETGGWLPISEAKKDYVTYILSDGLGCEPYCGYQQSGDWSNLFYHDEKVFPKLFQHMPLPPTPNSPSGESE